MNGLSQAAQHLMKTDQFLSWGFLPWFGVVLLVLGVGFPIFRRLRKATLDAETRFSLVVMSIVFMGFGGLLFASSIGTPQWLPLLGNTAGVNERRATLVAIDDAERRQAEILEPQMQAFATALSSYLTSETMGDVVQQALPERFVSLGSCEILRAGYFFSQREEGTAEGLMTGGWRSSARPFNLQYSGKSTPDFNGEESAYLLVQTDMGPLRVILPGRAITTGIRMKLQSITDNIGDYPTHVGALVARMMPDMLDPAERLEERNYTQIDAVIAAFDSGSRFAAIDGYVLHSQNDGAMTPTVIVAEQIALVVDATKVYNLSGVDHPIPTTRAYRFPAIIALEAVRGFLDKTIQRKWFTLSVPSDRSELDTMRKQYGL